MAERLERAGGRCPAAAGSSSTGTPNGASTHTRTRSRPGASRAASAKDVAGTGAWWRSPGSWPAIASSATAVSMTVRVSTPSAGVPAPTSPRSGPIETRPRLGFKPTSPQQAAGMRIEPPRSLPSASPTMPEATAAALPPDEPPADSSGSHGFRVAP